MKKILSLLILILATTTLVCAETPQSTDTNIVGDVKDAKTGEHIAYATVGIKGTTIGTTTDATGHYFLKNMPLGKFTLEARFVGYKTQQLEVILEKGKTIELNFSLEPDNVSLDEIVVSANRNETSRRVAPTLVSILDNKVFAQTNAVCLVDGLCYQPGLRVEDNCQNCGFTQVRMNGLDGAYSQILIDSRPIFSALAGVYGLEQLPANMIERVEVVRGGGSALFGASAIAGTINIITKEPIRNSGEISHNIMSIGGSNSFENTTSMNASILSDNQKMGLMVFGQKRHRTAYDHDNDGYSELPKLDARTLGFRSFIKTGLYSKLTLEYHNIQEFRRGGDNLDLPPFQANIAEQIDSKIDIGSVKFDISSPDSKHRLSVYASGQYVDRDSYYGGGTPVSEIPATDTDEINKRLNSYGKTRDRTYSAGGQYTYSFDKLLFMPSDLTTGIEYTHDELDDQAGYRPDPVNQKTEVKSFYAQNEWKTAMWSFLIGGRVDKHNLVKNAIVSPRANIRYNPTKDINLRLSYGQGFRAPQLYDEDLHVQIAGGEAIITQRDPNLKVEKSHSISASADWYTKVENVGLNFLAEGFFTRLLDPFTSLTEEQADGTIVKTTVNASGAKVYGINLEARLSYNNLLQLQVGATIQKSRYDDARRWSEDDDANITPTKKMMRTPDVYGFFVATVNPFKKFSSSISGNYTGRMLVPHEGTDIKKNTTKDTPTFFVLNWKVTYQIPLYKGTDIDLSAGIQNIFNAYQKDFDQGPDRASSYVYGPSLPRSYFMGAKVCF